MHERQELIVPPTNAISPRPREGADRTTDLVIMRLRQAEEALQAATTIHQAKLVADVAAAQEVFAHRQRLGDEIVGYAHQIKTYALAKLGELLADMPKRGRVYGRFDNREASPNLGQQSRYS